MATTTPNFGWAVPTSTDLVKDGAVAIETLGDSIDASLVDLKGGTTGQVLAKASGTDMDFTWTAIDPLVILDAKGDLITATAADTPARLAVGTNGQTLVADSSTATGLKWAAPAGGGKVLQVVQATTNTTVQSSSSAYADTTLTATITPTLSTSKILVMVSHTDNYRSGANAGNSMGMRLMRGATEVYTAIREAMKSSGAGTLYVPISFNYLDSPATTSATTYKTQFASEANTAAIWVQQGGVAVSTILLLEIGA